MLVLTAVLIWGFRLAIANWRLKPGNPSAISRAASIVVLVVLLHSIVDYPARTVAISCLFALASALQLVPVLPKERMLGDIRPKVLSGSGPGTFERNLLGGRRSRRR